MAEIMDAFWQAPPIARTLSAAILVTSVSVMLIPIIPYHWLYFTGDRLWMMPPEIWRLVTSFLLSSPQLGIILDPYFTFQYLKQLETGNPKFATKEDVLWYLLTVGGFIIVLNRYFTGAAFFLQALIIAICYTSVQDQRGMKSGFFFFTVPSQLVPYCLILSTLLTGGPGAIPIQISGIVAAHMHDFLTRTLPEFGGFPNILATPSFLSNIMQTPRMIQRDYGTAIRQPQTQGSGSGTGASTGSVLPDSWKTRGTGRRLGGS